MRLYVLQVLAGLAYGLTFLSELPLLLNLFALTPPSTHGTLLFVLWPAPFAAALGGVMIAEKRARLRRAQARETLRWSPADE